MKKIVILSLGLVVLVLVGCSIFLKNVSKTAQISEYVTTEISRKSELELEGFINDYFYRRQIKDISLFSDFNAYGSVLTGSIIVYVYPKNTLSQNRVKNIKKMIRQDLKNQIFDFSDFEWTKAYTFHVVVR